MSRVSFTVSFCRAPVHGRRGELLRGLVAAVGLLLAGGCCCGFGSKQGDKGLAGVNVYVAPVPSAIERVAVLPMKAPTQLIGESVSDLLVTEMLRWGRYTLVERSQMANVLGEAELALAGLSEKRAVEVAQMLGADGVIIGTVDEYSTVARKGKTYPVVGLSIRLIDCASGKIMWSASLAERADSADVTLPEQARGVAHCLAAAVQKELRAQKKVGTPAATAATAKPAPVRQTGGAAAMIAPPAAPSGLTVSDLGLREVALTWAPVAGGIQYVVERAERPEGPFVEAGRVSAATGRWTDRGRAGETLKDGAAYYYRVRAVAPDGAGSPYSAVLESMTAPPPDPPLNLEARSAKPRGARLTWTPPEAPGVTRYLVERGVQDETGATVFQKAGEVATNVFEEGGTPTSPLADSTVYQYRVAAMNRVGAIGPPSEPVSVKTLPPPDPPEAVTAESRAVRSVPVRWAAAADPFVTGYEVYRRDASADWVRVAVLEGRDKTECVDGGREPGRLLDEARYWYRVRAVNCAGAVSADSEEAEAVTRGAPPPVEGVAAEGGRPREALVKWTPSPDEKVVGYRIQRAAEDAAEWVDAGVVNGREAAEWLDRGGARAKDLGGLEDGTTYRYRVLARNLAGVESMPSDAAEARTKFAPAAPAGLTASTNAPRAVRLAWRPNPEPDIARYEIETRPAGESRFKALASVAAGDAAQCSHDGLKPGERREYRARAVDADRLAGPWSLIVEGQAKPLPEPPRDLAATAEGGELILKWTPPDQDDIREYRVYKKGLMGRTLLTTVAETECRLPAEQVGRKATVLVTGVDAEGQEGTPSPAVDVLMETAK